jgi:hypothetical protein
LHGFQGPKGPGNTPGGNQSSTVMGVAAGLAGAEGGSPTAGAKGGAARQEEAPVAGTSSREGGDHWVPFQAARSLFGAEENGLGRQESFPGFPNLNAEQGPHMQPAVHGFDPSPASSMGFAAAVPELPGLLPTSSPAASSSAAAGVKLSTRQQSRFGFARGGSSSSGGGSSVSGLGGAASMAASAGFAGVSASSLGGTGISAAQKAAALGPQQGQTQQQQQQGEGAAEAAAELNGTTAKSAVDAAAQAAVGSPPVGMSNGGFGSAVNLGGSSPRGNPQISSLMQLKSMLPGVNVHVRPMAAGAVPGAGAGAGTGSPAAASAGGSGAVGHLASPPQQHFMHQQPPALSAGMQGNGMGPFGRPYLAPSLGHGMEFGSVPPGGLMPPSSLPVGHEGFGNGAAGAGGNYGFGLGVGPAPVHGTPPSVKMNPGMALLQQLQRNARMEPSPAGVGAGMPGGFSPAGMVGGMGLPGGLGGMAGAPPGFNNGGMWSMNPGAGLDVKGPGGMPGMAGGPAAAAWPQAALWQ